MTETTRREFLKLTAAGVTAAAALPASAASPAARRQQIPPQAGKVVPGIHAYADQQSVAAGRMISFHVSNTLPCRMTIHRLGPEIDDPRGDVLVSTLGELPPSGQPIHPGSYVHVARRLGGRLRSLTLECWVRPWSTDSLAGLITQEDKESDAGFALGLGQGGYVGFFLGNGVGPDEAVIHRTPVETLSKGKWHHVVATWDGREKAVWVNGTRAGAWPFAGPFEPGEHPLRLGAMGMKGETLRFLDGDLALCAIYDHALDSGTIGQRFSEQGLQPAKGRGVLGYWAFAEERGDRVADASGNGRHGRIINHGTWMIGGPSFHADVPRFHDYEPAKDPRRGHGLRLAGDDLYDCRWEVTRRWQVPKDARPGIYVARLTGELPTTIPYHVTFIVRRAPHRKPAPMLVLCSTNTWRAYNGAAFGVWPDSLHAVIGTGGLPDPPGGAPAFCLYRGHAAGQGTYQVGSRLPWPVAGPYVLYGGPTRYSHLMRAERYLHAWLEQSGYEYDLATDVDLHRDPSLLRRHSVVILNGHSEYWSVAALRGLENHLRQGGNVCVLSGNSLFWRVSFNDDCSIMECRKVDAPGDQLPAARRGECWHSHDGQRGGLLRECGHPGWRLVGMETLGWNNQGNPKNFGPYMVTNADHPLFHQPEETGLKPGEAFGFEPGGGSLANGHEFDVRLSTLADLQLQPSPPDASVPADPANLVPLANGIIPWKEGGSAFDFFFRPIQPKRDQGGEMIYWERPEGGRVFHAGSIASGRALHGDPKFQVLFRNVLARFGVRPAKPG